MAYKISQSCIKCDTCRPICPTGAIERQEEGYTINPGLCNNCDTYDEPQCVVHCPISLPTPQNSRKGRSRIEGRIATNPDLFANGKNNPFASSIVMWEACNLLAQRESLLGNRTDDPDEFFYQRTFNQKCTISLHIADLVSDSAEASPLDFSNGKAISSIDRLDIRASCMHLIYASYATTLDRPWEQEFVINDRQIEEYLGLDRRKDLSKAARLTLIKEIAQQPCLIQLSMHCPQQGRILGFSVNRDRLWNLLEIHHHFQEDEEGCKHLVGLTFRIRAGLWTKYFLNKQGCKERNAFYQYGVLPKSVLGAVMSIWQQHEGAARMMLWLLFKIRMGQEQRVMVSTLMRIAYGEERIRHASTYRDDRKRLLRTFESDLEALNHFGLKPVFDPETYPPAIQPLWAKLGELPDDAEEALEFWMDDGGKDVRLTDSAPRGKWNLLMQARILWFDLPAEWKQPLADLEKKKRRSRHAAEREATQRQRARSQALLTGDQIINARKIQGLSQRELAEKTGKSQSWIRDIENGRFRAKAEDQALLRKVLGLA